MTATPLDRSLFNAEAARPLLYSFHGLRAGHVWGSLESMLKAYEQGADGVSVELYQIASGELLLCPSDRPEGLLKDGEALFDSDWRDLSQRRLKDGDAEAPVPLLEDLLKASADDQCLHLNLQGGFYGDIALAEECLRLIYEYEAAQRVFVTAKTTRALRCMAQDQGGAEVDDPEDRPDEYNWDLAHGWHLGKTLLGGFVMLEDHPLFELIGSDRVVYLDDFLITEANVSALFDRGLILGARVGLGQDCSPYLASNEDDWSLDWLACDDWAAVKAHV